MTINESDFVILVSLAQAVTEQKSSVAGLSGSTQRQRLQTALAIIERELEEICQREVA